MIDSPMKGIMLANLLSLRLMLRHSQAGQLFLSRIERWRQDSLLEARLDTRNNSQKGCSSILERYSTPPFLMRERGHLRGPSHLWNKNTNKQNFRAWPSGG